MRKNGSPAPVFESDEDPTWFPVRLPVREQPANETWGQDTGQVTEHVTEQDTEHDERLVAALRGEMEKQRYRRTAAGEALARQTRQVWYYDYRTNIHHTLKKKPMRYEDLSDFVKCYNPKNRHRRKPTWDENDAPEGRWRSYSYDELTARDKTNLDMFWLKDKSLTDLDNLPGPDELAEEIIENLEAGLNSFREVLASLRQADG